MKHLAHLLLGTMLLTLSLTACGASSGGPQAWLDWPLDNSTLPLEPLTIQAHASDENGIAQFEFFANDTPLVTFDSDGRRLGEAIIEWTPPEPGVYRIDVRAIDSNGNVGSKATVIVTVGGGMIATQTPPLILAETATTFAQPVDTETPAPGSGGSSQCALSQLVAPVLQTPADYDNVGSPVNFSWSDQAYSEIGCHPHSWRVDISLYSNFSDTSWGFGTLNHLETSRDWPLPAGNCFYWRVLAYVPDNYGPPSAARYFCIPAAPPPITDTPTATHIPTVTASPTVELITDTTPPSFFSTGVSPDEIYHQTCAGDHIVTVAAAVSDESGLSSVVAYWNIGGTESGQVDLQEGGLGYSATIGPVNTIGTMEVYITAWDNYGNVAQSDVMYVTVINCIN